MTLAITAPDDFACQLLPSRFALWDNSRPTRDYLSLITQHAHWRA
jgi:hypothetical protein